MTDTTPALLPLVPAANDREHAAVEAARTRYATDDLEIDDVPGVSPAGGGVWVSAWVWVADPEDDSEGEEE